MVTVAVQNVGRVNRAPLVVSAALRCSPLVALSDAIMMLAELAVFLHAGCSLRVAARHVWYDRFDRDSDWFKVEDQQRIVAGWERRIEELTHAFDAFVVNVVSAMVSRFRAREQGQIAPGHLTGDTILEIQLRTDHLPSSKLDMAVKTSIQASSSSQAGPSRQTQITAAISLQEPDKDELLTCYLQAIEDAQLAHQFQSETRADGHGDRLTDVFANASLSTTAGKGKQPVKGGAGEFDAITSEDVSSTRNIDDSSSVTVFSAASFQLNVETPTALPNWTPKDQFYSGSAIDGTWRLGIGAFLVGALPQAIKVFAMRGISITTTAVCIYLLSFIIPEIFRVTAGTAGEIELNPMPAIFFAKEELRQCQLFVLSLLTFCWFCGGVSILFIAEAVKEQAFGMLQFLNWLLSISLALPIAGILAMLWRLFKRTRVFHAASTTLRQGNQMAIMAHKTISAPIRLLSAAFALNDRPYIVGSSTIFWPLVSVAIGIPLQHSTWNGTVMRQTCSECVWASLPWFGGVTVFFCILICAFATLLYLNLFLRLLFRGSLSKYPRILTGMTGSVGELLSGFCMLSTFLIFLLSYGITGGWDPEGTYRPAWVENLG